MNIRFKLNYCVGKDIFEMKAWIKIALLLVVAGMMLQNAESKPKPIDDEDFDNDGIPDDRDNDDDNDGIPDDKDNDDDNDGVSDD